MIPGREGQPGYLIKPLLKRITVLCPFVNDALEASSKVFSTSLTENQAHSLIVGKDKDSVLCCIEFFQLQR